MQKRIRNVVRASHTLHEPKTGEREVRASLGRLVLGLLVVLMAYGPTHGADAQEIPSEDGASKKTVNVELIVDASGSMAAATDTGEIRVDAAKRVLSEVIGAIPDVDGINVGMRVYGHKGDNTEEARSESCLASELLVPINGVDKVALSSSVERIQPTGWTPIARSLEAAGSDFSEEASDSVVNAIVVLTDGIETCDGNPAAAARMLHESGKKITTHVIGFATTAEDQATLGAIAEAGGGQLLGAANASQLSAALFNILEELEIFVGAGYIGGNAFDLLPAGAAGEVAVVAFSSTSQFGNYPIVVRNNTGQDVSEVKASVTIRDGAGSLIAAGDVTPNMAPFYVRSGGLAIGSIYLGADISIPPDAQVSYSVSFSPAVKLKPYARLDFDVTEASLFENRIVGTLENGQEARGDGGVQVQSVCFDLEGNPLSADQTFLDVQSVAPGDKLSYQIDIIGSFTGQECPAFLVAGGANRPGSIPAKNLAPGSPNQSTPSSIPSSGSRESDTHHVQVLPTQDASLAVYGPLEGVVDAVGRIYTSPTDPNISLSFAVAEFTSEESAKSAIPLLKDRTRTRLLQIPGFSVSQENVDLSGDFDEAIGTIYLQTGAPGLPSIYVSDTLIRKGKYIMLAYEQSYTAGSGETSIQSATIAVGNSSARTGAEGVIIDGLWAFLPVPEEVPVGYVVTAEYVPVSFGPIAPK